MLLLLVAVSQLTNVTARHNHVKLRHERHRRQHAEGYLPSNFVTDTEETETGLWGPWSVPSSCSRSCGGGVAHQTRRCLDVDDNGYDRCSGPKRRFYSCNIQPCQNNTIDFRAEQCAEFNAVPFEGVVYDWIPYTGGPNKCELNCMPKGERFFYRHKLTVIDGTPCEIEKNDVCVEGKCMSVGCDLMLGSNAKEDACRECDGDGSKCTTAKGLFDTDDLQVGYIDILFIPEGATNIAVKEIEPSNNYLAIRSTTGQYYLNGNWRIDFPRSLRFAGTIFHYSRVPQGFSAPDTITAKGPTTEAIYIVLLYQDRNVGVDYEYSVPKKNSFGNPENYTWTHDEFSECSVTCGGGYQSRHVNCVRRRDNETVDENLCDPQSAPDNTQACNTEACPPEWFEGEWSSCSKQCGEDGEQTRTIKCEQIVAGGMPTIIDDSICIDKFGPKNKTTQECNRNVQCPTWHLGPWKPCDRLCGKGKKTRKVTCFRKNEAGKIEVLNDSECDGEVPESESSCELRPCAGLDWVTSEWSGCDDKCGLTQETRTAHCATNDGTTYPSDKCDANNKPELTRTCEKSKGCEYQWYAAQWSECSAKCGSGVQTRKVFCASFEDDLTLKKVENEKCKVEQRYNDTQECEADVAECKGEWFAGPWSKCSKLCGGGDMTRKVICMKDNMTVPTSNCDADTIMFGSEECNKHPCSEDDVIPVEVGKPDIPSDKEDDCLEYEDEDFVTFASSLGTDGSELAEGISSLSPFETTAFFMDNTMMSDAAVRGDTPPVELENNSGSGGLEDSTAYDDLLSSITGLIEGSGSSTDNTMTETTDNSVSHETTNLNESTSPSESTESSASTEKSDSTESSASTEKSESTETSGSTVTSDSTESSVSSETSDSTESSVSTESSKSSDVSQDTTVSISSTESSTDQSSSGSSESTENTSTFSSTEVSETASTDSSTSSSTSSETTSESLDSSSPITSSSETPSTDTTITESTISTSESTETTIISSTDTSTTETGSTETSSTVTSVTEDGSSTTMVSETSTDVGSTTLFSISTSDENSSTVQDTTTQEISTEQTTAEATSLSSVSSSEESSTNEISTSEISSTDISSTIGATSELPATSDSSTSVSSEESTVSGATTETGLTTESGMTTETGMTSESGMTTETGSTTENGSTTESDAMTEVSTVDMSTGSTETAETGMSTESITTDVSTISSSTSEDEDNTDKSSIFDLFTTVSSVDQALKKEQKMRKCKVRKAKKSCLSSEFNCCYDGITPAQGPFGKGCPTPETCAETQYGCCPDGVSVPTGPKNEGCPSQLCAETLFGCCQDGTTPAEGNDFEGCKKPCNETECGCCPDKETPAINANGCCDVSKDSCCPGVTKNATVINEEGSGEDSTDEAWTEVTNEYETTTMTGIEEDCANTTHGCCPDGHKAATGKNFEGCGVINTDNCTASYFGCCPDNTTAALGSNKEGCHGDCISSPHGCCQDKFTPAHGPNGEGCCLTYPHGCCPDNILPARGPEFYGCGCEYTRFGCCPDNSTAARGPENEGCGCKYTTHGCCPNRFTPANGPNFEGCPCYTYQFGCCPDGVTIAKGPHSQGCGCENTEFKCCSDGRTPATGPNFAGCNCDASKYGCCLDGIEEAQSDNFDGCLAVPTNPGAACALTTDRGSCRNFTVQWFYDTEYGGCSRFWYGGCEGNDNRFKSQEECKEICVEPKGRDACYLPKSTGPCEGYNPTWYYDSDRKQCGQFIYGGCLGNANKFKTRDECEQLCTVSDNVDPCEQEKESGPCQGNFTRWYFNKDSKHCEQFRYGGCKGNNNNFLTESSCHQKCLQPGHSRDSCSLPRAEGNCTEKKSKWYYDQSENRCMPFYYTGCGGNSNNFESREACETDCPPKIEQDTCLLPALLGECHNYTQRWYYDSYEQRCRQFYYGGCNGNGNNFVNEEDCLQRCSSPSVPAPRPTQEFSPAMCFLPDERGPCNEEQTKWFYDSREGICKQFTYGGCASNGNKFESREECEYRCDEVQDVCTMPKIVGPCSGSVVSYYYDRRSDTCEEFEYSGCSGNRNRFEDRTSCESKCKKHLSPPQVQATESPHIVQVVPSSPICSAPADAGPCNNEVTAYYYDSRASKCQAFIYGGCEGNANRFQTEEQCERLCGIFQGKDVCNLPAEAGPCRGVFPKYYYDRNSRSCRQFLYGGCDGNANRFSTLPECESVCIHREEPAPTGNNTVLSHLEICRESVDIGSCESGSYKRFYFNENRQTCMAFVYTGCGGNRNRFKTFESCMHTCYKTSNEIDVSSNTETKDKCSEAKDECDLIHCPYGKEAFVDDQDCERCRCVDPCRNIQCSSDSRCSIVPIATGDGTTEYQGICRSTMKPGNCPVVSNSTRCEEECRSDADCSEDRKCCNNGCGTSCLEPASTEVPVTYPPVHNDTAPSYGAEPATIKKPENPLVRGEEGGFVTMLCIVTGNPRPSIIWQKDTELINSAEKRRRILPDGSLQIINLYSHDRGIYICIADNGLAQPDKCEYELEVTEPHNRSADIISEPNTSVTVTLNAPTVLHCYAIGWPRPFVTWWHGDSMLPLSSDSYEQDSECTLLIRSVTLSNLGIYTCQAYNGIEKPASWSTTLQAIGPVYNIKPEQQEYTQYLVQAPKRPERPERPQYPYRPARTQAPEYNQTYKPIYPTNKPYILGVIGITEQPQQPSKFKVPVAVNVTSSGNEYPVGSEINIGCSVDGYPIPKVLWYKDGDIIRTDGRITISESNRLVITNASYNDTGKYNCEATNEFSSASDTIDINVAGIYIHPDCQDNSFFAKCDLIVKAKYCQHKYYAKFCCRSCTEARQLPVSGNHLK
ncbi:papilin isoform X3 [Aphidius gifuensis]|nr:papilin isoform X3 [Aphidius gifuensis]